MRARDVVVWPECFADANGHGFFADIKVCQARHQRARVQVVDPLFEQANGRHLPVHAQVKRILPCGPVGFSTSTPAAVWLVTGVMTRKYPSYSPYTRRALARLRLRTGEHVASPR